MRFGIIAAVGLICLGAVSTAAKPKHASPTNRDDVVVRSDVMLGVIRVYELMSGERDKPFDSWQERVAWFRKHFRVSAGLMALDGKNVVEVVTFNDSPTAQGGNRTFQVDLNTGEVIEGEPGR